jgi:heptosyltransferase III
LEAGRGLIIFPGALGDLICLVPAIHEFARRCPTIGFELMARAELARFAVQRMKVVAGHSIDRGEVAQLFLERGGESDIVRKFFSRFDRIDCFFASDNERFRSSLRQAATGEIHFYPFRPPGLGHVAECYLRAVGARVSHPLDDLIELMPDDLRDAQRRLRAFHLEPKRFVLVLPGSGSARKNWPAESFALLAERIQLTCRVLVVLGPAEAELAPIFQGPSLSVASNTELGELAGIAYFARCFIGNDSGVSHLAAALGARGLVIFGPSDPERWRPLGDVKIIQREPLEGLLPEMIWPLVEDLMKAGEQPSRYIRP